MPSILYGGLAASKTECLTDMRQEAVVERSQGGGYGRDEGEKRAPLDIAAPWERTRQCGKQSTVRRQSACNFCNSGFIVRPFSTTLSTKEEGIPFPRLAFRFSFVVLHVVMPGPSKSGQALFLGLELSTDQLRATIVDENLELVGVEAVDFDTALSEYQ